MSGGLARGRTYVGFGHPHVYLRGEAKNGQGMVGKAGKETTMSIYPLFTSVMMGAAYVVGLVRIVFSFLLSIHIDVF